MIIKRHLLGFSIIILIVIITTRNIIFHGGIPAGVDSLPPIKLISFLSEKSGSLNIWEDSDIGYVTPITLYHILSLCNILINNPVLIFKTLYIILSIGIGLGMYLYVYESTKSNIASIASSIIFLTNQWILAKIASGQMNHVFAYFLIPILFLTFDKCLSKYRFANIINLSFVLSTFILLRVDPIIYILPFLILYSLFVIITSGKERPRIIKNISNIFLIGGLLFIGLTFFILFPVIESGGPTHISISFSLDDVKNNSLDWTSAILGQIRQMSYIFWKGNTDWNTHQFLTLFQYRLVMLIIPILAFLAIFIRKEDKRVTFFILVAVISIFLAKGPNPPIGEIYSLFYHNIPFFDRLREPDRWTMATWFSYSYLTGITLKFLSSRFESILKRYTNFNYSNISYMSYIVLIILLPSFLGTWYIFSNGYETWIPQNEEIGIYNKILDNNNSRVATVPYGFTHMFNYDLGLDADIGRQSTLFSKRSVFAVNSEFNNEASDFYKYTQLLTWKELTNNMSKILGIYDVRFFVLQGYPVNSPSPIFGDVWPTYEQHNFFERQIGVKKIYEGEKQNYTIKVGESWTGILIPRLEPPKLRTITVQQPPKLYENEYWIPRIFSPSSQILMVSGMESFLKLADANNFNFDKWNIIFADHLAENMGKDMLINQINKSDYITFIDSGPLDLAMLLANATWIKVKKLDKGSTNWNEDDKIIYNGYFVYGRDVITANKNARAIYNFNIDDDSNYEIWIRTFVHDEYGNLKIFIDKNNKKQEGSDKDEDNVGLIENYYSKQTFGFKWIKLKEIELRKGNYKIEILNVKGTNKLNGIIIAKKGEINNTMDHMKSLIDEKSIYLIDNKKYKETDDIGLFQKNKSTQNIDIIAREDDNVKYLEFKEINPSKWIVKVNSTGPYTLVFSDSYHPMWKAYVNGKKYESIPSYYFINSFQMNESGEQNVTLEFMGQRIQNVSLMISGLLYISCIIYLFYDWRKKI